jgi:hypothetical protein
MTSAAITEIYGAPGETDNLTVITLPYPMKISWDLTHTVTKIQCHKLVAPTLQLIFKDLLAHYGLAELSRLKIDRFGGCYNFRKMRNGTEWSVHSWGIAIDLDPGDNDLTMHADKAIFDDAPYAPMIDIFYKHGWFSLGKEKNYDWMHFQAIKP